MPRPDPRPPGSRPLASRLPGSRPPGPPAAAPPAPGSRPPRSPAPAPPTATVMPRGSAVGERGPAAVGLGALLPFLLIVLAGAWQALGAAEAVWAARVAARAAARANAAGGDATRAARAHLPSRLERGLRVRAQAGGDVRVTVRIPRILPAVDL